MAGFGEIIDAGKVKSMAEIGECQFHSKGGYPLDSPEISRERRNFLKTKDLSEISPEFCSRENINKNSKIEI